MGSILVTGASGLLGKKVLSTASGRGFTVFGWSHTKSLPSAVSVDVTDRGQVDRFFGEHDVDLCIHCAANPDVNSCERDPEAAVRVNVGGTRHVAEACAKAAVPFILISTDYVFDGSKETYREDDLPAPLQVYGRTKQQAEQVALSNGNALVIRVPLLFGFNDERDKPTWPRDVASKLRSGIEIEADDTEIRQPALIDDVSHFILEATALGIAGILHATPPEGVTKYEWARMIARYMNADVGLVRRAEPVTKGPARPKRSWLVTERVLTAAQKRRETALTKLRGVTETTFEYLRGAQWITAAATSRT
jgi:dTDP-4-dehydrorhamnose reductase